MLKELWRKLGTDFMQPDCTAGDADSALFGSCGSGTRSGGFRILPHITHTGEFHLERLTSLLKARYSKSFEPSDNKSGSDEAIRELISYAARIQDQDVQRELLLFYLNCSPVIQEFLRSETSLGDANFPFR
ncbi:hypothetical protein QQF73_15500 [Marinobacter sp. M216]|uniref:Uncharacterized protein n=1 Tax=Marinobacter albus TaxID=3030833 RepID=A0ABT7HGC1_9GAMM|nr:MULTISPECIES: hypothetical protein [unclassified Marinobacter]MBW7472489.1 hypothetical protein [Marinobacter sp. F4218]MDK9559039.1 hypothetical protein [Marinobacter sp. M216]